MGGRRAKAVAGSFRLLREKDSLPHKPRRAPMLQAFSPPVFGPQTPASDGYDANDSDLDSEDKPGSQRPGLECRGFGLGPCRPL